MTASDQSRAGIFYTLSAFMLWGIMPLFMKAVSHVTTLEVLASRIIWSIPVALVFLLIVGRTRDIVRVLFSPSKLAAVAVSAIVISINWGVYVWAIAVERTIEAALGYYINPLFSIALGMVFLGEKLGRLQIFALALAILAVSILTYNAGAFPWVAIILAGAFAIYGLIKKTVDIGPTQGFMLEVLLLSVIAVPYVFYLGFSGSSYFGRTATDTLLLLACGPVTAVPLILFAYGTKRLRLATVGIMQYIIPTMILFIGVFIFDEPFDRWQFFSFLLIWTAIVLYTWSGMRQVRMQQVDPV